MRPGRTLVPTLLLALLGTSGAARLARAETGGWFALHTWGARHGLPENAVRDLLTDRQGYLWIATHAGVARFDGIRFAVIDDRDHGPLQEIEVQAMTQAPDGSLWMATYGGGITRLKDGHFTTFTSKDGLANDFVVAIAADGEGGIWTAGAEGGVSRWKDGKFRTYTTADGLLKNQAHVVFPDRDGSIWIAHREGGLSRLHQGKFQAHELPGVPGNVSIRSLVRDARGRLWLGTEHGLFRRDGDQTRAFTVKDGLASTRIYRLAIDAEDNLWIASDNGLSRHRDGQIETQVLPELAGRGVTAVAASPEGGVFAGAGSLSHVRRSQFQNYGLDEGLPHQMAVTFFQDRQGRLWIGTIKGLACFQYGKLTALNAHGLPDTPRIVGAIDQDPAGHLWVGTDAGLYRSRAPLDAQVPSFVFVENQPSPAPERFIQARVMFVDRDGALWIGAVMEGLVRWKDGVFTSFTTKDGLLHNAVRGIQQDREGALWMGTRKGLNRLKDGKFTGFTTANGLAHDTVESLHLDRDQVLWIGTRRGVNRLENGRFTTLTVDQGLLASYVNSFAEDDQGHLWMVSIRGVFRAHKRQLAAVSAGTRAAVTGAAFGVENGLVSTRSAAGFDRSVFKAADGRIWAATARGAAVVDPHQLQPRVAPPPVLIEEVQADRRTLDGGDSLVAAPGRGDLAIQYTGLSFVAPEKVRFRYQLEGYDPSWVDAGHRRTAFYSNLPPGPYRFRVQAANSDSVWNTAGATVAVRLAPHWFQTWLFRIGALLAAVMLAVGVYGNHVRQLKRRQRQLEHAVADRTAELAAANKELETFSYSVSHDLRAPLRSIEGFGRALLEEHAGSLSPEGQLFLNNMRQASERMERLIDDMLRLARVGRTEMHRQAVDLSALADDIASRLAREQPGRQVEMVVTPGLVASADPSLVRVAMENLIGNAWKFTSKRTTARIELGQSAPNGSPIFFVRDNGAGFEPAHAAKLFNAFQRLHPPSEFDGNGVGLTTVRRVIQRHGGRIWAEAAPDAGATFYFTLPEEPAARGPR